MPTVLFLRSFTSAMIMEFGNSPTAMNFTENQHGNVVLDKLRHQKDTVKFCDVVFHLHDKEYFAHRNVLAACSPYFESMLKTKDGLEHLNVNCAHNVTFEVVLNYVYTGKVVIDESSISETLKLANQFMISKLKGYCSEYLERTLNVSNVFKIKEMAEKCGLPQLAKTADAFVFANLLEIMEQQEILEFSSAKLDNLLSNKSIPLTEEMRLHMICRWVNHDIASRQYDIQHLLGYVKWQRINVQTLYNIIGLENSIFSESEWCMFQMLQTLEDCRLLFHAYRDSYLNLKKKLETSGARASLNSVIGKETTMNIDGIQDCGSSVDLITTKSCSKDQLVTSDLDNSDLKLSGPNLDENETADNSDNATADVLHSNSVDQRSGTMHIFNSAKPTEREGKEKNRRKGIPIKVRIPKAKIKLEIKLPKKRGRPAKVMYKKDLFKSTTRDKKAKLPKKDPISDNEMGSSDGELVVQENTDEDNFSDYFPEDDLIEAEVTRASKRTNTKSKRKGKAKLRKLSEKINCPKCFFFATSAKKMETHINTAHKDDTTFQCGVCDFKSKWNREYYHHMKMHFDGPSYRCDHDGCDYLSERIQPLLYHRMIHTDERPFSCTICNMKFRTRNNLTTHLRCHTGEKPFECIECHRRFATKGTMEQHLVTHSDHRPYLCDKCGFSTKYQSHLIAHKRIHSGDVFRCQYPNCKYFTPKRSQLACHMRSHMDIRQHICSVCGRGFVEKSHLVRHERIHLEEKPFQCEQCDYTSTRRDKLKEHVCKYHGQGAKAKVPYKPRRARRQNFNPQVFPGLAQSQAQPQNISCNEGNKQTSQEPTKSMLKQSVQNLLSQRSQQQTASFIKQSVQNLQTAHVDYQYASTSATACSGGIQQNISPSSDTNIGIQNNQINPPITSHLSQSTVDGRSIGLMVDPRNINLGSLVHQPLNLVQQMNQQRHQDSGQTLVNQPFSSGPQHSDHTQNDFSSGFMGIF